MQSLNFSVEGDRFSWIGATDPSLGMEARGLLWWLMAKETGLIEPSEYEKPLLELCSGGYLIAKDTADMLVLPSPFTIVQSQVAFDKAHALGCIGKKGRKKQRPLGERFYHVFRDAYNKHKAPKWQRCGDDMTISRVKAISGYLRECKRLRGGEFLAYALDVFERALMWAAHDEWWMQKQHSIMVFLKVKSDYPFAMAERYHPNQMSSAMSVANSWAMTSSSQSGGLILGN